MNIQVLTSYLGLLACEGIGVTHARTILEFFGDVTKVFSQEGKQDIFKSSLPNHVKNNLISFNDWDLVSNEIQFMEEENIHWVGILDENYPILLKECVDAPIILFYKGNLDLFVKPSLAIVGTRNITNYGKQVVLHLIESIALNEPIIVSGMAYGVDIEVYHQAVKHNLKMVGVMGTSFKKLYPARHKKYYQHLFENGLVVSEYAGFNELVPELFIRRNRIIAGITQGTVVVESAFSGGSLSTAYFACDYGREVYAIPGKIDDVYSKGCLRLIQENRAQLLYDFSCIAEDLSWNTFVNNKEVAKKVVLLDNLNDKQKVIVKVLEEGALHIDLLGEATNLNTADLNSELMMLELEDVVIGLPGKLFALK